MSETDHDVQESRPQGVGGRNLLNSIAGRENLNLPDQDQAESGMTTRLPVFPDLINLGSQASLIELFPMAAYAVRAPDGVIAWFNSRAVELWGRVPAVGDTDERFCGAYKLYRADGTHMAHCDTPVALALETGTSVHEQEVVIERPDGSRVSVSVHIDPIRDERGAILGVVNFFHDISERRQTERSTAILAAIVDTSDDAIVSKNLDGIISSWNRGAERLFGYSPEEAIGQNIRLIIPPGRWSEEEELLARLRRGERIDHFETVRLRKDGTAIDISVTISPLKDAAGRVIGASKIGRDISERKQTEARLKELHDHLELRVSERTAELQKKNRELLKQTDVVRDLSGRLLQTQDEERRRIARELHDSAGQLLAAINMNISKVAREKDKLSPSVGKCVEESANLVEQALVEIRTMSHLLHPPLLDEVGLESAIRGFIEGFAKRSKIDVNLIVAPGFERLSPDLEIAIFRVIQECLTNVHRHSGSRKAEVRLARRHGCIHLEVSDEGKGIPLDKQLDLNSPATLGVGFRGMRERIRQLGGTLQVHSNGNGTSVEATLPIEQVRAQQDSL
jgi:PAS domain S-box-containing protein